MIKSIDRSLVLNFHLNFITEKSWQELYEKREEAMRRLAAAQPPPQSLQPLPADSEDPLGMILRKTTERRSDYDDIMVVPAPPPPPPPPPSMDENPLGMVRRQETFLSLRNSQFGEWNHSMFSDYRRL